MASLYLGTRGEIIIQDKGKKPKAKSEKTKDKSKISRERIKREIIALVVFMLAIFVYISVSRFSGRVESTQFIGVLGTYILKGLELLLGSGALFFSFYLLFWSMVIGIDRKIWSIRMWGASLIFLSCLLWLSLYDIPSGLSAWEAGTKGMGGGILGGVLVTGVITLLGKVGATIILILNMAVAILLIVGKPIKVIIDFIINSSRVLKSSLDKIMYYEADDDLPLPGESRDQVIINHPESSPGEIGNEWSRVENAPLLPESAISLDKSISYTDKNKIRSISSQLDYQKPPLDLLGEVSRERIIDKKNIKESIGVLEDTFANFGIKVKVNQVSCGPAVTRYELTPAPGVKVSRILSLTDDLQLNLAAPGIRIEAPIPGKSAVGIEVPNSKLLSVGLRNLLSSPAFKNLNTPLAFALGEDISGNTVVGKLNDMPHLLIAGSTGSGKSVCINSMIMIFLFNSTPDELKFVFIDPKMVELAAYNGIPHLMTPVVTDPKKASVVLRWMVSEMEKRYKMFADRGVRDIQRFNQLSEESLPYIVIIIDELADLMMVSPVEVEDSICRLAQMSRAAGMHLIVATQRPSVDVVTGIIKANIPSRIAFAVSSQADSRTILDSSGAEKLLGKGDMLFLPVGAAKPYRVQGAYVSDGDIEKVVNYVKEQLPQSEEAEVASEIDMALDRLEEDYGDELFWDAVSVFVENRKASVSLLQRRLRIGYARAARLVDLMEDRGIVSELDSSKKREVLIDREQLDKLCSNSKLC
ncbi:MAG: DNA translocase FtsK [Syntrophomonas sp.]|uniref:DNA translocase FtsK n=1 Tax=Syntrophomonas sp. TaxID=2053627 RepID=UPI0026349588|nr:DNA translocase FtsK [Syntrophomonas sp.]MDD2509695.1 DNA translocase FtsK [Syntrophomonas sp.]MDD3880423.1 DNA translocase FtsK [Syntrophomonas sp.]MDD4625827.1 DNA translocase FtsK [Syntrophomonas sp.]